MSDLNRYESIWLVGASTGIGAALAKVLDKPGRRIYISARSTDKLEALSSQARGELVPVPLDISDSNQVEQACSDIESQGGIDMLILNAGTCEYMDSDALDMDLLNRVMQTNFFSITDLIKRGLPLLYQKVGPSKPEPKLVVMSSSVTYQALPRAHAYGASKAALRYFTECLKTDIQQDGIDVRVVSPGFVETPLTDKNDFEMPARITSEQAADEIVKGLEGSAFDIHFPKRFTLGLKFFSRLPTKLKFKLLQSMSRHSAKDHELSAQKLKS